MQRRERRRSTAVEQLEVRTLLTPAITATKDDQLASDQDGDGKADPGDVIQYTVRLDNTGSSDATDVLFADTLDPNTTLVPGSINVSPLALSDNYLAGGLPRFQGVYLIMEGGGSLSVTEPTEGLFFNDVEFLGDTFTLQSFDTMSAGGGSVHVNPDGTFSYEPPTAPVLPEIDTFTYTIVDAGGLSDTGTVSIDLRQTVLTNNGQPITFSHVNDSGAPGDGSFESPFGSLTEANLDPNKANRNIIYVESGTTFENQRLELSPNQRLLGQGHGNAHVVDTDQVEPAVIPLTGLSGAPRPDVTAPDGFFAFRANQNTQISNFTIDNNIDAIDLGVRGAISTPFGDVKVDRSLITGGHVGIDIAGGTGTFTFTDVDITDATDAGVQMSGGGGGLVFFDESQIVGGAGGTIVRVTGGHDGVVVFNPGTSITATNGDGLQFADADGVYDFRGQVRLNGGDAGIDILGGSAGTFTFTDTTITNPTGAGLRVDGGSSSVDFSGLSSLTKNNLGSAVRVQGGHDARITFGPTTGIFVTGAGAGDGLQFADADGVYDFRGQVRLSGGDAGIDILGDSAGTFTFTDTTITNPTGAGLRVDGGSSSVDFSGLSSLTKNNLGSAVRVQGGHDARITFGPTTGIFVTGAGAGDGLQFADADGVYDFRGQVQLNGGDAGIDILGGSAGTFTFSDTTAITDPSGHAFRVQEFHAGGRINFGGSIDSSVGEDLLNIEGTQFGSIIKFNSTGGNTVSGNGAGGLFATGVNGRLTIETPTTIINPVNGFARTGISLFGGTGVINFRDTNIQLSDAPFNAGVEVNSFGGVATFHNLEITTAGVGTVGLAAFGSRVLNVTGTSSVATTGGDGIDIRGVNSVDITLDSISVTNSQAGFGAGKGITLSQIGDGFFDVTGTTTVNGANGIAGIGVDIDNANGVFTFETVDIDTTTLQGISIGRLSGNPGTVNINGGTIVNPGDVGVLVNNAARVNLSSTTIHGSTGKGAVEITSSSGTSIITSTDGTFQVPAGDADGVRIIAGGTGELCLHASGSNASGSGTGFGLNLLQTGTSTLGITQTDLTEFRDDNTGTGTVNSSGTISFDCVVPNGAPLLASTAPAVVTLIVAEPIVLNSLVAGSAERVGAAGSAGAVGPENAVEWAGTGEASGTPDLRSGTPLHETGILSDVELTFLVDAAIERWSTTGLSEQQRAVLAAIDFRIEDMPGWYLGAASGLSIQIDADGGGAGWFIDPTPLDDSEFLTSSVAGFDLLTTVMHEMGHVLGLTDVYETSASGDTMFGFLSPGERRIPTFGLADGAIAGNVASTAFIGSPINIGTLPVGKSVTVMFRATINSPFPPEFSSVSNQGTVSGSNFGDVVTDDPDTAETNDATRTEIETASPTLPGISISDAPSVTEGQAAIFTVSLSAASSNMVTLKFSTEDGIGSNGATAPEDFVPLLDQSLSFPPGETTGTITITINDDTVPEDSETFFVNLFSPTNGAISKARGVGTILDDDGSSPESSSIHGRKWEDVNGDGIRQIDEPWLNGWTIQLTDLNGNVLQSDVTMDMDIDLDGSIDPETERGWYWFTDVPAGDYILREVEQAGWRQTAPFNGLALDVWELDHEFNFQRTANDWFDWGGLDEKWFHSNQDYHFITPDGDLFQWDRSPQYALGGNFVISLNPEYYADPSLIYNVVLPPLDMITVGQGEIRNHQDFGNEQVVETDRSLHGRKFDDRNGNGVRESGEPYLNGWMIELRTSTGELVSTQETMDVDIDNNGTIDPETERGWYQFDVQPGTHMLTEVVQTGWRQTAPYSDLDLLAWQLNQQLRFVSVGSYYYDYFGLREKWFRSSEGAGRPWHYITPQGDLYRSSGGLSISANDTLVASLDPSYHMDPLRLIDAQLPTESLVHVSSAGIMPIVDFGNRRLSDPTMPPEEFPGTGNVSVSLRHKNLTLIGDEGNNGVTVSLNELGRIVIKGLGDTTLNGSHDPIVTTGWGNIPNNLAASMNGGDDVLCLHGISVTNNLRLNFGRGDDYLLGNGAYVGGHFNLADVEGNNFIGFSGSRFDDRFTVRTGDGDDVVYADNVQFLDHVRIRTGGGPDLLTVHDTYFGDAVRIYLESGNDDAVAGGVTQFNDSVTVDGGPGFDRRDAGPLVGGSREPTFRKFESDSVPDRAQILDDIMRDLANHGLDGLLTTS